MALILAGGHSRRFGRDKASFRPSSGEPTLAGRIHRVLAPFCGECFLSVRANQSFPEPPAPGLPTITDQFGDAGPMGALLSAWEVKPTAAWFVIACDLIRLDSTHLRMLVEARDGKELATAFLHPGDGKPEPLCAIYEPGAKAPIRHHFDQGRLSLRDFLRGHVSPSGFIRPLNAAALSNANRLDVDFSADGGS